MYRPEGWKNPYAPELHRYKVYEAGADALLEGLKKDITPSHRGTDGWYFLATKDAILYRTFIPVEPLVEGE